VSSSVARGDCFTTAHNDMRAKDNALPAHAFGRLQSASGEELSPPLHFGDASRSALMPSVLDRGFKGEL
jgi:hypothetical protein